MGLNYVSLLFDPVNSTETRWGDGRLSAFQQKCKRSQSPGPAGDPGGMAFAAPPPDTHPRQLGHHLLPHHVSLRNGLSVVFRLLPGRWHVVSWEGPSYN